jgi:uroporphyrinogen-III synthase
MARQSASNPVPVLLTRPLAQSTDFAAKLIARFGERLQPVISPLMAVDHLTPELPKGQFAGVIFTSTNGVEAALPFVGNLPKRAYCVGAKTAQIARKAGFDARSADGDADALVAAILTDPFGGRLLHIRGKDTRGNVAERLTAAGVETVSVVVYRQERQELSPEGASLLLHEGAVIIPLFSPRSAEIFVQSIPSGSNAQLRFAVISAAVAAALPEPAQRMAVVAPQPDADGMLDAVGRLLVASPPP